MMSLGYFVPATLYRHTDRTKCLPTCAVFSCNDLLPIKRMVIHADAAARQSGSRPPQIVRPFSLMHPIIMRERVSIRKCMAASLRTGSAVAVRGGGSVLLLIQFS